MSNPQFLQSGYADFFGENMLPILEQVFFFNLQRHQSVRDIIFKKVPHDREIYQYSEIHDMSLFSTINEGADYTFEAPPQGYDKTLTVIKYGLGFSISEEAVSDGKYNYILDATAKLAKSAKETQEQAAMDIFNNGFTTETTADGQPIFSTSHPTPSGSITIANKPTTDVDLGFTSLSNALSAFKKAFRGDSGIYYTIMPKILLVPTELELYANQLIKSNLEADSANNNINPFQNQIRVVASAHLTDPDAWFLIADPVDTKLEIVERWPIQTIAAAPNGAGYVNDNILYKTRYREVIGCLNQYGLYGTTGA